MASIRLPALWVLVAIVYAGAAVLAWWLLPHGFGAGHSRFWINEVLPIATVGAGGACLFGLWRRRVPLAAGTIAAFAAIHVGMAVAWLVVFPITGKGVAFVSAVIALALCVFAFASLRHAGVKWSVVVGAAIGALVGAALPWAQRGADPRTHPAEPVRALVEKGSAATIPRWVHFVPQAGAMSIDVGPLQIELQPLLTFLSRSPDRGWTVFADNAQRMGPPRRYAATDGDTSHYAGDEPAVMRVSGDDVLHVEVETVLPKAVYSHLNTFCALEISGHHRLFLAFSPMPAQHIEVKHSEYPVGRPARFAYLDASHVLHVVQAESGEKGPFTELAHGPLPAGAALGITLYDEQQPIARIDLADFASQASTQLSPTAGWGVPENAIEFSLREDRPDAAADMFITLAGTSVGRGWDSVGHAPGLYRNRIDVRPEITAR